MKVTFLKPSFAEKSNKVKVTFEVDAADLSQIMSLKQGESYEIAPVSQEVAEDEQTPTEKLETAQRLISEAMGDMGCDTKEPELPLHKFKKCCGTCAEWTETVIIPEGGSMGDCPIREDSMNDTEGTDCPNWKDG